MSRSLPALLVILALGTATLPATVIVPTEFREVVASATVIVRGRVTDVRSAVMPGTGIETVATVAVDVSIKGGASGFVSLRVPGGTVGRSTRVVVGAPKFTAGQQAVFFLRRGSDNALRPVGLSLGVYPLQPEPGTGRAVVAPPAVVGSTVWAGPVVRGTARRALPILEFESLVRLIVASQGGPSKGDRR